ncbi:tRNA synthetases class II (A)-domain-containing protein [Haematococcus lacustris]
MWAVTCIVCCVYPAAASLAEAPPATQECPTSTKLSGAEIRERFLAFYEARGHTRLPSSSLVPEDPTVLLTIAGMLQFKPVFLGQAARKVPRATTTQKCVRTNDIENVGVTARHHTFFEMLGNFSFGDYFKKEAVQYAWELSTRVFGLPADRVWVSVYEEDEEAYGLWRDVVGVPAERIKRMGAADNFWASGPTGPCGPCSELYYDFHPERGPQGASLEDDSRFIEFYNLVFMELNRGPDGSLTPLAAKNIDTGMGLERMAQILQAVPNNYETDLVFPIVSRAAALAGLDYHTSSPSTQTALKVIGDHIRAVVYLISDGVTPSNVGRGYIVRRLLRRVVMKGRLLGIRDVFTPQVAEVAVSLSGPCDPQLATNAPRIYDVLRQEEAVFSLTLERGQKQLTELLAAVEARSSPSAASSLTKAATEAAAVAAAAAGSGDGPGLAGVLSGADAFLLYDSFGFPLELTQEIAEQRGIQVDVAGFKAELASQRLRSKEAREVVDLTAQSQLAELAAQLPACSFTGYSLLQGQARVQALLVDGQPVQEAGEGCRVEVVLDATPFYAESGGQVGDRGLLQGPQGPGLLVMVEDVKKAAGGRLFVHSGEVQAGRLAVGDMVSAVVDEALRRQVRAHHTATHLLQSALRRVLGPDTCQQGSLVDGQRLRFDFNLPRPMTPAEVEQVEGLVNSWVLQAVPASTSVMALQAAKAAGATAMFGEKYEDEVRVVDVPGISMELCGGTHVSNTSEIGLFKVLSEGGIASGVRRIEAVAGAAAVEHVKGLDAIVKGLTRSLKVQAHEVPERVAGLQAELKARGKEVEALRSELTLAKAKDLAGQAVVSSKGARVLVAELPAVDAKAMQEAAAQLVTALGDPAAVVLATRAADGAQVNFAAAFSPKVVAQGLQAGKVVGAVARVCGGNGGGKPALAQAGGKDASKLGEALELARNTLMEAL